MTEHQQRDGAPPNDGPLGGLPGPSATTDRDEPEPEAPSGLPDEDAPEEGPPGEPEAEPGEEPSREPERMPGIPTEGEPPSGG